MSAFDNHRRPNSAVFRAAVVVLGLLLAPSPGASQAGPTAGTPQYVFTVDGRLKRIETKTPAVEALLAIQAANRDAGLPPVPIRKSLAKRLAADSLLLKSAPPSPPPVLAEGAGVSDARAAPETIIEVNNWRTTSFVRRRGSLTSEMAALPAPIPPLPGKNGDASGESTPANETDPDAPEPPPPDVWTAEEIAAEKAVCERIIQETGAKVAALPPIKNGACGNPAPVSLAGFGGDQPIRFSPPPRINCRMVGALARWIEQDLQAAAMQHLGKPIGEIKVLSGYACRNVYGRKNAKLSQHALANAIDIGGFVTTDGQRARVVRHWGPTERDLAALAAADKAREEAERAKAEAEKAKAEAAAADRAGGTDSDAEPSAHVAVGSGAATKDRSSIEESNASIPKRVKAIAALMPKPRSAGKSAGPETGAADEDGEKPAIKPAPLPKVDVPRMTFLKSAHTSACRIFGTVLGPEANDAHRDHFHLDLTPRRRNNFCE